MDTGDTAWVLISSALILFMTPGLAFFYAGMVRSKNVLGMLMQNYFAIGLISVLWALLGFTIAFGGTGPGRPAEERRQRGEVPAVGDRLRTQAVLGGGLGEEARVVRHQPAVRLGLGLG